LDEHRARAGHRRLVVHRDRHDGVGKSFERRADVLRRVERLAVHGEQEVALADSYAWAFEGRPHLAVPLAAVEYPRDAERAALQRIVGAEQADVASRAILEL